MNANRRCKYKVLLRGGIGELCYKIGLVQLLNTCWDHVGILFDVICEFIKLILRRRSPTPESGNSMKVGLIVYYVCTKLCGLSAFSGELDSLLRCAGSVGEAGASYVNK